MRYILLLVCALFATHSFAQKKGKKEDSDEFPLKTRAILGKPTDSILVMHWLLPTALKLYEGKIELSDNKDIIEVMDKASGGDAETRPLYIHLLMYANFQLTEGGLADSLGRYNMKLLERYPKEVLRYFKKAETDKRYEKARTSFQYNIAFELNGTEAPEIYFDEFVERVYKIYKNKNTEELDDLLKGIKKAMKK
jgi:hypothetical protein